MDDRFDQASCVSSLFSRLNEEGPHATGESVMRSFAYSAAVISTTLLLTASGSALADPNGGQAPPSVWTTLMNMLFGNDLLGPDQTGQPNQSCEDNPTTPGNSGSAPGSAFNPAGKAGTVYAGEQTQNSKNTASVSQYDVACTKQPR